MTRDWLSVGQGSPPLRRTAHLDAQIDVARRTADALADVDDEDALEALRDEAAVASLRLDGSPITAPPDRAAAVPEGTRPSPRRAPEVAPGGVRPEEGGTGTWLDAFGLGERTTDDVVELEFLGVRRGLCADDLAARVMDDLRAALVDLHRRVTAGLVPPDHQGRWRRTRQVVQDMSVGQVLLRTVAPEEVPQRIAALGAWLAEVRGELPGLVASGVVHHELLATHPFESANGRLARIAARLVLRAHGLDPHGAAPFEATLAEDPIGYYREVAATLRRRDLTIWLERWGEAVASGLRRALRRAGRLDVAEPPRAARFLADHPTFTIVDYRRELELPLDVARHDLEALLDTGRVRRVPGARGLRFERV